MLSTRLDDNFKKLNYWFKFYHSKLTFLITIVSEFGRFDEPPPPPVLLSPPNGGGLLPPENGAFPDRAALRESKSRPPMLPEMEFNPDPPNKYKT